MTTVIFYNIIILSSTFFVWLSGEVKTHPQKLFLLSAAFLIVFLPSAVRYDIGADYLNYLAIYKDSDLLSEYRYIEPGFYYVNFVLKVLGAHPQWSFAAFSFIFTAVAFKCYPKRDFWLFHFLFFSSLWFFSLNGIRQAISISFCLLAIVYFLNGRRVYFLVFSLIGISFHQSAIFITISGVLATIPIRNYIKIRIIPIFFVGFSIFTFLTMSVVLYYIEQVLTIVGLTKYAAYFTSAKHFATRDFGSGLGVLAKILFSMYIIINTRQILLLTKEAWIIILLNFIYAISVILAAQIIIFSRIAETFVVAPIVGGWFLWQLPNHAKLHKFVLIFFLAFQLLTITKSGFGVVNDYGDPKLNPYQSIISR